MYDIYKTWIVFTMCILEISTLERKIHFFNHNLPPKIPPEIDLEDTSFERIFSQSFTPFSEMTFDDFNDFEPNGNKNRLFFPGSNPVPVRIYIPAPYPVRGKSKTRRIFYPKPMLVLQHRPSFPDFPKYFPPFLPDFEVEQHVPLDFADNKFSPIEFEKFGPVTFSPLMPTKIPIVFEHPSLLPTESKRSVDVQFVRPIPKTGRGVPFVLQKFGLEDIKTSSKNFIKKESTKTPKSNENKEEINLKDKTEKQKSFLDYDDFDFNGDFNVLNMDGFGFKDFKIADETQVQSTVYKTNFTNKNRNSTKKTNSSKDTLNLNNEELDMLINHYNIFENDDDVKPTSSKIIKKDLKPVEINMPPNNNSFEVKKRRKSHRKEVKKVLKQVNNLKSHDQPSNRTGDSLLFDSQRLEKLNVDKISFTTTKPTT